MVPPYIFFGGRDQRIILNPAAVKLTEITVDSRFRIKSESGKTFINLKTGFGLAMRDYRKMGFVCHHSMIVRRMLATVRYTLPEMERENLVAVKFQILPNKTDDWFELSDTPLKMYE